MATDQQLAVGWSIAWRAALVTGFAVVAAVLALRWFLHVPSVALVAMAAVSGLAVGWRLPPARLLRRQELRY